jgi:hypothetical protein
MRRAPAMGRTAALSISPVDAAVPTTHDTLNGRHVLPAKSLPLRAAAGALPTQSAEVAGALARVSATIQRALLRTASCKAASVNSTAAAGKVTVGQNSGGAEHGASSLR